MKQQLLKIAGYTDASVSFKPHDEASSFQSEFNTGLSAGKLAVLSMVPTEHIQRIIEGDPEILELYMPSPAPNVYLPQGCLLALFPAAHARPVVRHDVFKEVSTNSLPGLSRF